LGIGDGEKGDNTGSPVPSPSVGSDEAKLRVAGAGTPYSPIFSRLDNGGGGENPADCDVECS
jgi:hypothetical protein